MGARPQVTRRTDAVPTALALLVLVLHISLIFWFWGTAYSSPDASGYYYQARLLALHGSPKFIPEAPPDNIDPHYLDLDNGTFVPRYPPGLPLILAAAFRAGGPNVALAVNPILATCCVWFIFLLGRRWAGPWAGLTAAVLLATVPAFTEHALLGFAHTAVAFFLLAGLLVFDSWLERPSVLNGLSAGLLLGIIPTIRSAEAILALGFALAVLMSALTSREHRKGIVWLALGVLVPLGLLMLYQNAVYGGPLRTGYSLTSEDSSFGFRFLRRNWLLYLQTLMSNAGPVVVVGLAGISAMLGMRERRLRGSLLLGMIVPTLLTYAAYYWHIQDIRFLVPILPLFVLGSVIFVFCLQPSVLRQAALASLLVLHLAMAIPDSIGRLSRTGWDIRRAEAAIKQLAQIVPTDSIVVGPMSIALVLRYDGRWRVAQPRMLWPGQLPALPPHLRPYDASGKRQPSPAQPGRGKTLRVKYAGLEPSDRNHALMNDLMEWAPTQDGVYWVGSGETARAIGADLADLGQFVKVGEIKLPEIIGNPKGFGSPNPDGRPQFWTVREPLEVLQFVPR